MLQPSCGLEFVSLCRSAWTGLVSLVTFSDTCFLLLRCELFVAHVYIYVIMNLECNYAKLYNSTSSCTQLWQWNWVGSKRGRVPQPWPCREVFHYPDILDFRFFSLLCSHISAVVSLLSQLNIIPSHHRIHIFPAVTPYYFSSCARSKFFGWGDLCKLFFSCGWCYSCFKVDKLPAWTILNLKV